MPYSYPDFKNEVIVHLNSVLDKSARILDVGPGSGGYYQLLENHGFSLDAVEIHEPYLEMFELRKKYNHVYVANITDFDYTDYDYLIFGDILEHLAVHDAQKIIKDITQRGKKCLVAVPYQFVQGPEFNNVYEAHIQDDLTPEIMVDRYPELRILFINHRCGYYINYV